MSSAPIDPPKPSNPTSVNVEDDCFKENSQDANGVILFTTTPNQLNWRDVKSAFIQANLGWVERVDLIPMGKYKKAYIYIAPNKWNFDDNKESYDFMQKGNAIRVYYQQDRYFNTRISTSKRTTKEEAIRRIPKVRIELMNKRD